MLPADSDKVVEDAVGIFVMALSFASDGEREATALAEFCDFYNLRCYDYRKFQARQWGISVREAQEFVYLNTPHITVFNTPGYLRSQHTAHEFGIVRRSVALRRLVSVELGGSPLPSIGLPIKLIQGFSSEVALTIIHSLPRTC